MNKFKIGMPDAAHRACKSLFQNSVYTLYGEGSGHGQRRGKLINETSMFILLQWDDEEDLFYLLDTCYKLTFIKD